MNTDSIFVNNESLNSLGVTGYMDIAGAGKHIQLYMYTITIYQKKTLRQSSFRMSPKQVDTYIILIIHGKRTCK